MGIFLLLSPTGGKFDRSTTRPVSERFSLPRPVMADKRCFNRQRCRNCGGILCEVLCFWDRNRPSRCSSSCSWRCCSDSCTDHHHWRRCCNCRNEGRQPGPRLRSPLLNCFRVRSCGLPGGVAPCGAPPDPPGVTAYAVTPTGGKRSKAEPMDQYVRAAVPSRVMHRPPAEAS